MVALFLEPSFMKPLIHSTTRIQKAANELSQHGLCSQGQCSQYKEQLEY